LTIHGATPRGLTDSTGARFHYFICTLRPGPSLDGVWTPSQIRRACGTLTPAVGAVMGLPHQQLLVAVTPRRPGVVVFYGLDLKYAAGWRDGTQHIGGDVRIPVVQSS
jgi:hypothetical protein